LFQVVEHASYSSGCGKSVSQAPIVFTRVV
jgi:hypothetical protein